MLSLAQPPPPRVGLIATGRPREAARLRSLQGSTTQLRVEDRVSTGASAQTALEREKNLWKRMSSAIVALLWPFLFTGGGMDAK